MGVPTSTVDVQAALRTVMSLAPTSDDSERIDRIRVLEELKSAASAAQMRETAQFAVSQTAAQAVDGVPTSQQGRGVAGQVALARRISPWQARRFVGWSNILTTELPETFEQLRSGHTTEWRALLVARETAWLSAADRASVDAELAPALESLGDRQVEAEARRLAYRLDPQGYVARLRTAEDERRVTVRPRPDVMCALTGTVPVAQGVAMYAALCREADAVLAVGEQEGRTRGQLMADLMVERVTGQAVAGDVPVEVCVVMTDGALFADGDEPAVVLADGQTPVVVPADIARDMITRPGDETPVRLRRLFRAPRTGELLSMETRSRFFTTAQRQFLRLRDQYCAMPWCGAPIRHADHVQPAEQGGPTRVDNGAGLCAACNYAKQAPGWSARVRPPDEIDDRHEVLTTTPTGHSYAGRPPPLPGAVVIQPAAESSAPRDLPREGEGEGARLIA